MKQIREWFQEQHQHQKDAVKHKIDIEREEFRRAKQGARIVYDWNNRNDVVGLTPDHWISPIDFTPVGAIGKAYKGGRMVWTGAKLVSMGFSGFGRAAIKAGVNKIVFALGGKLASQKLQEHSAPGKKSSHDQTYFPASGRKSPSDPAKSYQQPKRTGGGNRYTPKVKGRCRKGFYYDKRLKQCVKRKRR